MIINLFLIEGLVGELPNTNLRYGVGFLFLANGFYEQARSDSSIASRGLTIPKDALYSRSNQVATQADSRVPQEYIYFWLRPLYYLWRNPDVDLLRVSIVPIPRPSSLSLLHGLVRRLRLLRRGKGLY